MTEMGKDYAFGRPELDVAIAPNAVIYCQRLLRH